MRKQSTKQMAENIPLIATSPNRRQVNVVLLLVLPALLFLPACETTDPAMAFISRDHLPPWIVAVAGLVDTNVYQHLQPLIVLTACAILAVPLIRGWIPAA